MRFYNSLNNQVIKSDGDEKAIILNFLIVLIL